MKFVKGDFITACVDLWDDGEFNLLVPQGTQGQIIGVERNKIKTVRFDNGINTYATVEELRMQEDAVNNLLEQFQSDPDRDQINHPVEGKHI